MEDCTLVVVLKAYLQLHKFYIMSLCILNLCCNRMILCVAFGGGKHYIILWVQTLRNGSLKAKRWIMVLLVWMRTVTMFLTSWYPDLYKVPSRTESRLVFLVNVCVCVCTQSCVTLCNPRDCGPPGLHFPGKNTGVGCYFLLQGIFLTQGLIEPTSLRSPMLSGRSLQLAPSGKPKPSCHITLTCK